MVFRTFIFQMPVWPLVRQELGLPSETVKFLTLIMRRNHLNTRDAKNYHNPIIQCVFLSRFGQLDYADVMEVKEITKIVLSKVKR